MSGPVERCGICDGGNLESVLHLGSSPATCSMRRVGEPPAGEIHYPLELLYCHDCSLVQLSVIPDPVEVFPDDYPYSSGNSQALHDNFTDLAAQASRWLGEDDLVVDIGANDGTLLGKFNCRTVGVEPTSQAKKIEGTAYRGTAYQAPFTKELAGRIITEHGPAKVVTACNVLAHVEDPGEVMRGIDVLLADDGVLIAENHDLASVLAGQWDTVYHEHLRYYSPYSFNRLLNLYGFGQERKWRRIPTHGGSFRMIAGRGAGLVQPPPGYDFAGLREKAKESRAAIRKALSAGEFVGIGATARATTAINYCGLDAEDIPYVCEVAGSDKIGRYIPGTRIPVVDEQRLLEDGTDAVLFSWHLADQIVPKLRVQDYRGLITAPLPTLRFV